MYFITFSRQMGTKGTEVAKQVAKELLYDFYDTEAIEKVAEELGFLRDVREIDEKAPPFFKRVFSLGPEVFLKHLNVVIYELARRGSAVFLGRGSNMLFRSVPCALHVRIIASHEKRVQHLLEKGLAKKTALAAIEKSDRERARFIKFAFNRDWANAELYDIVLNMDHLTVDAAATTVANIARAEEIRTRCFDGERYVEMMCLALRVEAALMEGDFLPNYVSVSVPEPGKVRLSGVVQVPWEKTNVERLLSKVKGVESLDNQIEIASATEAK